jgi:hypothetical protein
MIAVRRITLRRDCVVFARPKKIEDLGPDWIRSING